MTASAPIRLKLQLLPTPGAPGIARRRLAEEFAAQLDSNGLQDAKLLTSELVTNAFLHGRGPIELTALLDENRFTVDVTDRGEGFERPTRERELQAVGGHGLNIVNEVASRWGIHDGSSHVWFELDCGERLGSRRSRARRMA
jgi:anti-sigma regulatory factor (Ser/Thr protein kinase)